MKCSLSRSMYRTKGNTRDCRQPASQPVIYKNQNDNYIIVFDTTTTTTTLCLNMRIHSQSFIYAFIFSLCKYTYRYIIAG